jgi:hypothetical protein
MADHARLQEDAARRFESEMGVYLRAMDVDLDSDTGYNAACQLTLDTLERGQLVILLSSAAG